MIIGGEAFPGRNTTDADLLNIIQQTASSIYHAAATCAMGNSIDPMPVVDSKARVIGVSGLRVVDASAFPFLPPDSKTATRRLPSVSRTQPSLREAASASAEMAS